MRALDEQGESRRNDDFAIDVKYQAEYAGLVRYYLLAQDVFRLGRLHWFMETSLLKTLAGKHRGRKPLVTRFGGIALRRVHTAVLTDRRPVMASTRRNELIHRLLAGRCEICEDTVNLEVHHVRRLADLTRPGRPGKPAWMHLMAMRRRKTLVCINPGVVQNAVGVVAPRLGPVVVTASRCAPRS